MRVELTPTDGPRTTTGDIHSMCSEVFTGTDTVQTLVRPHHDILLLCKSLQHRAWRVGVVKDSGTGRGAALVALLPRGREGSRATSF